ncbi:AraC family transcriptional regulator [Dysgonomonas sp. 520]|uniref:helix-turn-helix domain-containing protein n=1 Tax=Dysgonomonas sp. 520 TaxID=2302931 RepID=UPI0013D89684|nr:helix-turn-helix domain-containing protein [Dysgonomonas sp. 520]NDW09735.1 AraC family transcriptional regulator [Dysgonomonas sp. 520]
MFYLCVGMDDLIGNKNLISLEKGRYLDVVSLENADDNYWGNYQRYDFYQVMWLKEANKDTSYLLDFEEYCLKGNQVLIIFPGQIDRMDVAGKKGYIYAIENNLFFEINLRLQSAFLNGYYGNVFLTVDDNTSQILENLTQMIETEIVGDNRLPLLRSYMEAFLFYLVSLFEQTDLYKKSEDTKVGELMRLIDIYFIDHREMDFYADKMNLTSKKMNMICIKGTGKTVKQHIQERVLLEAKKEIRLGRKSLKEIAFDLGFNEAAYFSRFFKKHTSYSPREFRCLR